MAVKRWCMLVPSSSRFKCSFLNYCSMSVSEAEMMDRGDKCENDWVFLFAVTGFVWWTGAQRTGEALIVPAFLGFSHCEPFKEQKLSLFLFFPPSLHPCSKEYEVILDTTVPLETPVNLETREHQDCLVQGGWMESAEFLECQAFRVHQWVSFDLITSMCVWLLIVLFSAGTWCIWPTYCWSGPEDVAGWVSRPKYSVGLCGPNAHLSNN